jgi:Family of unknown function (DUF6580)
MNKNFFNPKFLTLTLMILAAAFTRLIPHYPNFTAVGAMALFGGAYFTNKKMAFVVPLLALFISDLFIGFYSGMWIIYLSFILIVFIGMSLRKEKKAGKIVLASLSSSVVFFLITNFALLPGATLYPHTFTGIIESYMAAIPFFGYNVIGDLFFVTILFGSYELARAKFPKLAEPQAA